MRVVGIGGGHGLAATLRAGLEYADDVAAIVTVADDGGSSGRLTRELGIPPPGDIRNCLIALAPDSELARLFQHRFNSGALTGHAVGNLVIAGLGDMLGDFGRAVAESGALVGARGSVFPATTARVALAAFVGGGVVRGQVSVATTTSPIQAAFLEPPDPPAYPPAVDAIMCADQVVLGPGSLFTSLLATVLVPGIRAALQQTRACRIFVCNTRMQKGETEGLDATAHLAAVMAHCGPYCVDVVVVQSPEPRADGVRVDDGSLGWPGVEVIRADVAGLDGGHDPVRLAAVLAAIGPGRP